MIEFPEYQSEDITLMPPKSPPSTRLLSGHVIEVKGQTYEMVYIPGGEFLMGSENGWDLERPVHKVVVRSFVLGRTSVTQGFWQAVMGSNPSRFKKGDNYPVESVSWNDCQKFLKELKELTGKTYRLPSEAHWEYACRAGTVGDRYGELDDIAWYDKNLGGATHPVGLKLPNAFGLYDMLGNVREWCQDWISANYYAQSPSFNPPGPETGQYRVCRGGSWIYDDRDVRSALRSGNWPDDRAYDLGARFSQVF